MKLNPDSKWSVQEIEDFLVTARIPLRLAVTGTDGYPVVCSLWFAYHDGALWSASHKSAYIVRRLRENPRVGFEIATNDYPYRGVRGKADAELVSDSDGEVLGGLIDRYLQGSNEQLASWLLGRKADEFAIRLSINSINAWDFSDRMKAG